MGDTANLPSSLLQLPPIPFLVDTMISYEKIYKATDGFSSSNLIGAGSFGMVYKGIFDNDPIPNMVRAIKVLNLEQRGATKSFIAECNSLRVISHRNLVRIVTMCSSIDRNGNDFKTLILEYMPNGNLDEWLHPRAGNENANTRKLSLLQRINIVLDVAFAFDYLHNQCQMPIVHCDLKSSNVLLDSDMGAHVSDFGLSRFLFRSTSGYCQATCSSNRIIGSIGYIAPEYGMGSSATTQGDVYIFGVLLLETFTGKRPTDDIFRNNLNLHAYVGMAYPNQVLKIVDRSILGDNGEGSNEATYDRSWLHEFMLAIFNVGLLCSRESPDQRLNMKDVVKKLLFLKETLEKRTHVQASGDQIDIPEYETFFFEATLACGDQIDIPEYEMFFF